jgi:hypothetical protein
LLADTYNEIGKYDLSFFIYKELIKNNIKNKKIILNMFNNLVFMGNYAESLYFNCIIHEYYKDDPIYNKNFDYLKRNIIEFQKQNRTCVLENPKNKPLNKSFIRIQNKYVIENIDKIIELLGKQQQIHFQKYEDKFYFDKIPDTTFFIDDIIIDK